MFDQYIFTKEYGAPEFNEYSRAIHSIKALLYPQSILTFASPVPGAQKKYAFTGTAIVSFYGTLTTREEFCKNTEKEKMTVRVTVRREQNKPVIVERLEKIIGENYKKISYEEGQFTIF